MKSIAIFVLTLCCSFPASAAVSSEEFSQLKADLMLLTARVQSLEIENRTLKASSKTVAEHAKLTTVTTSRQSSWADSISLKGDFRYRYEHIDAQHSNTRERNRIRARAALIAKPADDWEVGIGIATGGEDPVSTNQTLGGGATTKDVRLDLAYFNWQAKPGFNIIAGKMNNTYYRTGGSALLWDGDLRPEGIAVTFNRNNFFVNAGFNFLESDTGKDSSEVYGAQVGFSIETGLGQLTTGVSYFDLGVEGLTSVFGDDDDFFGNTFSCTDPSDLTTCSYLNDYEEVEVFAELATSVGDMPLKMFADYVRNNAADDLDTGWAVGFKLGRASARNSFEVAYTYQDLEADAVFGLTTDSDFGGGGTDAKGHIFKGGWAVRKNWKVGITYLLNKRNMDIGIEEDYDRIQIDTAFKF